MSATPRHQWPRPTPAFDESKVQSARSSPHGFAPLPMPGSARKSRKTPPSTPCRSDFALDPNSPEPVPRDADSTQSRVAIMREFIVHHGKAGRKRRLAPDSRGETNCHQGASSKLRRCNPSYRTIEQDGRHRASLLAPTSRGIPPDAEGRRNANRPTRVCADRDHRRTLLHTCHGSR